MSLLKRAVPVTAVIAVLVGAGAAQGAFPGSNGRIAFARGLRTIYSVTPAGGGMKQLTGGGFSNSPAYSPDGRRIAFYNQGLSVMNAGGSGRHVVVRNTDGAAASWSPNSGRIAFSQAVEDGSELSVVGADGSNLKVLGLGGAPTWSPVANTIIYVATAQGCDSLRAINADGRGGHVVLAARRSGGHCLSQARDPDFSPAGHALALTRVTRRTQAGHARYVDDVVILNLKTHRQHLVTHSGRASQPAWSPDGRYLAYVQPDGLWVIRSDGRGAHRIVRGGSDPSGSGVTGPSWQPTGSSVARQSF